MLILAFIYWVLSARFCTKRTFHKHNCQVMYLSLNLTGSEFFFSCSSHFMKNLNNLVSTMMLACLLICDGLNQSSKEFKLRKLLSA